MAEPRRVAGLLCTEVLQRLPDFVDGTLDDADRQRVSGHLAGCSWCERFGGAYASVVRGLRAADPGPDLTAALDGLLDGAVDGAVDGVVDGDAARGGPRRSGREDD